MTRLFAMLALSLSLACFVGCKDQDSPAAGHSHAGHAHHDHDHAHGHAHDHAHGAADAAKQVAGQAEVKFVNVVCPVGDEKIKPGSKHTVTVEHEGKTYALCCADCIEPFKKDPAKYLAKLGGVQPPATPAAPQAPAVTQ